MIMLVRGIQKQSETDRNIKHINVANQANANALQTIRYELSAAAPGDPRPELQRKPAGQEVRHVSKQGAAKR